MKPTILEVTRATCATFDLTVRQMRSRTRVWTVSHPRQLAVTLCLKYTGFSRRAIADWMGLTDHKCVIHAGRQVAKRMIEVEGYAELVAGIESKLGPLCTKRDPPWPD